MADHIEIRGLRVKSCLGVPDEERQEAQEIEISVDFPVSGVRRAAASDDIAHSVDYYAVVRKIEYICGEKPRKLIETLAEDIAEEVVKTFELQKLRVEIRKFVLPETRWVGIRIERP